MMKVLADARLEKGQYELKWNTAETSAGIYFLQLDAGVYSGTKKVSVINNPC